MNDCKFEVGKKYRLKDNSGWALLLADKSKLGLVNEMVPLVFINKYGITMERKADGGALCKDSSPVLPIEYKGELVKYTREIWISGDVIPEDSPSVNTHRYLFGSGITYWDTKPHPGTRKFKVTVEEVDE